MDSTGFVIVSGTDDVLPVLAYSTESIFNPDNIPPNMAEVLDRYKQEIRYVVDNNLTSTDDIKKQWNELISGKVVVRKANAIAVSPLLGELKWNQAPIYNDSCPYDPLAYSSYGYKCPAGCVAVAMAQIIKYWGYPAHGTGSKCYQAEYGNDTNSSGNYGTLCANFGNTTYNYGLMPDEIKSSSSVAEKRAVAQLIYHCGVAVNMAYGPHASGSYTLLPDYYSDYLDGGGNYYIDARTALKTYFGYSQAEGIYKKDYTETEWINILKEQLSNWQPVLYAGRTSNNEGHAFVCDGYDANDFFHINWGWGGSYNCYTQVSSLLPEGQGIGGGSGGFNEDQKAIINIRTAKDEKTIGWIESDDYINGDNITGTLTYSAFTLLPDTCLRVYINLENQNASSIHGMGMIFDPYSASFGDDYDDPLFDKSYPYRLDTMQITGLYSLGRKGYDTVHPDTLRVYLSYYAPYSGEPSKDYRITSSLYDPTHSVLLPNIVETGGNPQKGDRIRPVSANTVIIDYILTKEDTAEADTDLPGSFYYRNIKIPITYNNTTINGFEVPAGAVIGTMVKFIPGYNYNQGDTLYYGLVSGDQWVSGYPILVNNLFRIGYFESSSYSDFLDYSGYNGVNFELSYLRYQQYHSYQDSCYYANDRYLPRMAYHITYDIAPTHAKREIDTVVCGEYMYNGFTYNESGRYTHRFQTPTGDSVVVINLTVYETLGEIGNIQGNSVITQTGTYTYSVSPVTNAAVYQWTISNPQWIVTGTGTQISLNITEPGMGILSVKAIHANGICESEVVTLSIELCHSLGIMGEIRGENLITATGKYTYSISAVENAVSYQWEISNSGWNIVGNSTSTSVDLYVDRSSLGTLSVKAFDDCRRHSQKDFTIQANVSIEKYEDKNNIRIYPNPVEDVVFVLTDNLNITNGEIQLFDVFGRLLKTEKIVDKQTSIGIKSLSAGVYIIQIKENNRIIKSSKIVKI
jgi:hypothetical protein